MKKQIHRYLDPVISLISYYKNIGFLKSNAKIGINAIERTVPFYSQFASPKLIYSFFHEGLDPKHDPNWRKFGARSAEEYSFWSMRSCGIVCLKSAIDIFGRSDNETIQQLIDEGVDLGGYMLVNKRGDFVDQGWYYGPLIQLGEKYGVKGEIKTYVSITEICTLILNNYLVVASVSPEIGEADCCITKYGGHLVIVHGFIWRNGNIESLIIHNPSGRFEQTRKNAIIKYSCFQKAFSHKAMIFTGEKNECDVT